MKPDWMHVVGLSRSPDVVSSLVARHAPLDLILHGADSSPGPRGERAGELNLVSGSAKHWFDPQSACLYPLTPFILQLLTA